MFGDQSTLCLFSGNSHTSPDAALAYAASEYGFDFRAIRKVRSQDPELYVCARAHLRGYYTLGVLRFI
eukprot:5562604-Pyramimonas_sp.AAC.2